MPVLAGRSFTEADLDQQATVQEDSDFDELDSAANTPLKPVDRDEKERSESFDGQSLISGSQGASRNDSVGGSERKGVANGASEDNDFQQDDSGVSFPEVSAMPEGHEHSLQRQSSISPNIAGMSNGHTSQPSSAPAFVSSFQPAPYASGPVKSDLFKQFQLNSLPKPTSAHPLNPSVEGSAPLTSRPPPPLPSLSIANSNVLPSSRGASQELPDRGMLGKAGTYKRMSSEGPLTPKELQARMTGKPLVNGAKLLARVTPPIVGKPPETTGTKTTPDEAMQVSHFGKSTASEASISSLKQSNGQHRSASNIVDPGAMAAISGQLVSRSGAPVNGVPVTSSAAAPAPTAATSMSFDVLGAIRALLPADSPRRASKAPSPASNTGMTAAEPFAKGDKDARPSATTASDVGASPASAATTVPQTVGNAQLVQEAAKPQSMSNEDSTFAKQRQYGQTTTRKESQANDQRQSSAGQRRSALFRAASPNTTAGNTTVEIADESLELDPASVEAASQKEVIDLSQAVDAPITLDTLFSDDVDARASSTGPATQKTQPLPPYNTPAGYKAWHQGRGIMPPPDDNAKEPVDSDLQAQVPAIAVPKKSVHESERYIGSNRPKPKVYRATTWKRKHRRNTSSEDEGVDQKGLYDESSGDSDSSEPVVVVVGSTQSRPSTSRKSEGSISPEKAARHSHTVKAGPSRKPRGRPPLAAKEQERYKVRAEKKESKEKKGRRQESSESEKIDEESEEAATDDSASEDELALPIKGKKGNSTLQRPLPQRPSASSAGKKASQSKSKVIGESTTAARSTGPSKTTSSKGKGKGRSYSSSPDLPDIVPEPSPPKSQPQILRPVNTNSTAQASKVFRPPRVEVSDEDDNASDENRRGQVDKGGLSENASTGAHIRHQPSAPDKDGQTGKSKLQKQNGKSIQVVNVESDTDASISEDDSVSALKAAKMVNNRARKSIGVRKQPVLTASSSRKPSRSPSQSSSSDTETAGEMEVVARVKKGKDRAEPARSKPEATSRLVQTKPAGKSRVKATKSKKRFAGSSTSSTSSDDDSEPLVQVTATPARRNKTMSQKPAANGHSRSKTSTPMTDVKRRRTEFTLEIEPSPKRPQAAPIATNTRKRRRRSESSASTDSPKAKQSKRTRRKASSEVEETEVERDDEMIGESADDASHTTSQRTRSKARKAVSTSRRREDTDGGGTTDGAEDSASGGSEDEEEQIKGFPKRLREFYEYFKGGGIRTYKELKKSVGKPERAEQFVDYLAKVSGYIRRRVASIARS